MLSFGPKDYVFFLMALSATAVYFFGIDFEWLNVELLGCAVIGQLTSSLTSLVFSGDKYAFLLTTFFIGDSADYIFNFSRYSFVKGYLLL